MYFTRRARQLGALLIAVGGLMGAIAGIGPAALAQIPPDPGAGTGPAAQVAPVIHVTVAGGLPGWQVAIIAITAAVVTSVGAVLIDRARAGRLVAQAH
jgi:hypothetical protein